MTRFILLFAVLVAFAACNSATSGKEGTTVNGFKYVHHISNEGEKAETGDYVYFQVEMSNGDSIAYDSRQQPPGMPGQSTTPQVAIQDMSAPNAKPSPVMEALTLMTVGDSLTVYYPLDSLEGRRPPGYEEAENILYHLVMQEIKSAEQVEQEKAEEQARIEAKLNDVKAKVDETLSKYKSGELENVQKTESGLEYVLHEAGEGETPQAGQTVVADYYGVLESDGTMFDNSFERGQPFAFPLGQGRVIQGWDEGFGLLSPGAKATLFIPYDLAYGAAGRPPQIPEKADLVFYVEMLEVQ